MGNDIQFYKDPNQYPFEKKYKCIEKWVNKI